MKFNIEIELSQDELDILNQNKWFEYYTPCYRTHGEMTYELKGLIKKNIIIKKYEYNEYFYDLTNLGENLLKQYKLINIKNDQNNRI